MYCRHSGEYPTSRGFPRVGTSKLDFYGMLMQEINLSTVSHTNEKERVEFIGKKIPSLVFYWFYV